VHDVIGAGTVGGVVTLSGSGAFGSATSYVCFGTNTTTVGADVEFLYSSATSFTIEGTGSGNAVSFVCIGS
jgi:hypothetical protein